VAVHAADHVVPSTLDDDTVPVGEGAIAGHVGADEVAVDEVAEAGDSHAGGAVARDDIAVRSTVAPNRVVAGGDEHAVLAVAQGGRADEVGTDEVPFDDVPGAGAVELDAVARVARDDVTLGGIDAADDVAAGVHQHAIVAVGPRGRAGRVGADEVPQDA